MRHWPSSGRIKRSYLLYQTDKEDFVFSTQQVKTEFFLNKRLTREPKQKQLFEMMCSNILMNVFSHAGCRELVNEISFFCK